MLSSEREAELIREARKAAANAYAPYSRIKVGAAVLGGSGRIYQGCNVENASYGLGLCAERVAIHNAVAYGERELAAMAVASESLLVSSPCGACRQVMHEFNPDLVVVFVNPSAKRVFRLQELLPAAFDLNP